MKVQCAIVGVVITVVANLVFLLTIDDWSDLAVLTVACLDITLVLGLVFMGLSPDSSNADLFVMSTEIISLIVLIVDLIVGAVMLFFDVGMEVAALIHGVWICIGIIILALNLYVNKKTVKSDAAVADGMRTLRSVQSVLDEAMRKSSDVSIRREVERAYDAVGSMVSPSDSGVDHLNMQIFNTAKDILKAVEDGDDDAVRSHCGSLALLISRRETLVRNR